MGKTGRPCSESCYLSIRVSVSYQAYFYIYSTADTDDGRLYRWLGVPKSIPVAVGSFSQPSDWSLVRS